MPGFRKRSGYRKRKGGKRRKWRQQKLAVGTVQRIARDIAKREDKKLLVKYVHSTLHKDAASTWVNLRSLPPLTTWESIPAANQDTALPYKIVSAVGGNVRAARMTNQSANDKERCAIRIHGIETFGVVYNESSSPMRLEVRLIFVPNLNQYTTDAIDYLRPRITMFHDTGAGNLLRSGYNRKAISAYTATGHPIKFQTLARKVIWCPAASSAGTITPTGGGAGEVVTFMRPAVYKRFKLAKYFKSARTGYCNESDDELANGNYYLVYWNDLPGAGTGNIMKFLACSNLQYSMKGPLKPDITPS